MVVRLSRGLCVALLYLIVHLALPGCSSTEEVPEDERETMEEDEFAEEGTTEEGGNFAEEGGEFADDEFADDGFADDEFSNEGFGENEFANEEFADDGFGGDEFSEGGDQFADNMGEVNEQVLGNDEMEENLTGMMEEEGMATEDTMGSEDEMAVEDMVGEEVPMEDSSMGVTDASGGAVQTAQPAGSHPSYLPEMGSKMPYIVKKGDTLVKIAEKIFGNREMWRDIASLSSLDNPNVLYVGDVVYYQLTEESLAFASAYEGREKVAVTVQAGDTLSSIARAVTGTFSGWRKLWRQNDIENPDRLTVGSTLYYVAQGSLQAAVKKLNDVKVGDLLSLNTNQDSETENSKDNTKTTDGFQLVKNYLGNLSVACIS